MALACCTDLVVVGGESSCFDRCSVRDLLCGAGGACHDIDVILNRGGGGVGGGGGGVGGL